MTADDDNNSQSDNSGSGDATRDESPPNTDSDGPTRQDALPLVAAIKANGGWVVKEEFVAQFGIQIDRADEHVEILEEAGDIEVYELGKQTLLVDPMVDYRDAIAALSDREERKWRWEHGWETPDWEGFSD